MFVIPSWAAHEHVNRDPGERAILFSVHDTPVLRALDKYREEPLAVAHQDVIATFTKEA
jgi:gentisate 1,2-dioxygenase